MVLQSKLTNSVHVTQRVIRLCLDYWLCCILIFAPKLWISEHDTNHVHWSTFLEALHIPQHRFNVVLCFFGCVRSHLDYSNTVFLPGIYFSWMDCADFL